MTSENKKNSAQKEYPVIAVAGLVPLPGLSFVMVMDSLNPSVEAALDSKEKEVLLVCEKEGAASLSLDTLHKVGCIARIESYTALPKGNTRITFLTEQAARLESVGADKETATAEPLGVSQEVDAAVAQTTIEEFLTIVPPEKRELMEEHLLVLMKEDPRMVVGQIVKLLKLSIDEQQKLLEANDLTRQMEQLLGHILNRKMEIESRETISKSVKEAHLRAQIRSIQKELGDGDGDGDDDEADRLEKAVAEAGMPDEVRTKCEKELKKLRRLNPADPEVGKVIDYLEHMAALPWDKQSETVEDLARAQNILDEDHFGLEDVKERIIEHLAVQKRTGDAQGSIICLVGPPGVGKTSLGKSIAKATGREFLRIALGGVRDESDIRGHRRTYIGAVPGRIIEGMKKAGTINPVVQLDEIDKLSSSDSHSGNPSSAMLEVLDPEQNGKFNDHYLGVDYDLSNAMFVCTANDLGTIPGPLRDRMEIIEIHGYTEEEKMEIAKRYLLPKAMKKAELGESAFSLSDDALQTLISRYTREAGVRGLEREIAGLVRKAVVEIEKGAQTSVAITTENLEKYAGIPKVATDMVPETDQVGHVNGLYVTGAGGGILNIQADTFPTEKGASVSITGQLGDVMKESAQLAVNVVRANAGEMGIDPKAFENTSIHIHAPAGAVPKDGPSAGLALVTAITSALTGIPVQRDVAMTGEVDLLGNSLPIGGVKSKLLGALHGGAKKVLIPEANVKDLAEVPDNVKAQLEIVSVKTIGEVLQHALTEAPIPLQPAQNAEQAPQQEKKKGLRAMFARDTASPAPPVSLQQIFAGSAGNGNTRPPANQNAATPPAATARAPRL